MNELVASFTGSRLPELRCYLEKEGVPTPFTVVLPKGEYLHTQVSTAVTEDGSHGILCFTGLKRVNGGMVTYNVVRTVHWDTLQPTTVLDGEAPLSGPTKAMLSRVAEVGHGSILSVQLHRLSEEGLYEARMVVMDEITEEPRAVNVQLQFD